MTILVAVQAISAGLGVLAGIFGLLGKRKAQKKAKKIEQVAQAVITGIETYTRHVPDEVATKGLKRSIQAIAYKAGIENELHDLVKNTTEGKPLVTKLFK